MKTSSNKKLVIITILVVIVILSIFFPKKTAYEIVEEKRDIVIDYELISTNEMDDSMLLYSSGIINDSKDNIYYVDMVKKTLTGYKWLGGGGHINRDIIESNKDFIISIQLLNEEQNITPTALGIITDDKVIDVIIDIPGKLTNATIYDGRDKNEKFYVVHIDRNITDIQNLIVRIMYTGGSEVAFLPSDEEMERLQKGRQIYINEEDID